MPETVFHVPVNTKLVTNPSPSKNKAKGALSDECQAVPDGVGMREQPALSGSLLLDGRSVQPCVLKARFNLTEEYPRSLVSGGLGGATTITTSQAIITGNLEALKELFHSGRAGHVDQRGNTALHIAAKFGQVRALR